jgi:hypothetical protein
MTETPSAMKYWQSELANKEEATNKNMKNTLKNF